MLKFDSQLLENFVYRFTLLSALTELVPVISLTVVASQILPFISHLADDGVPNIRFNVAKSYAVIVESLIKGGAHYIDTINGTILPSLKKLTQDEDFDVKYFAKQSLNQCNELLK